MYVGQAPIWANAPLDQARTIFRSDPDDGSFALGDAGWTIGGEGVRLHYSEGATFWIDERFDTIWLDYAPPLTAVDAAYFLLEPVLAFVLRRRGALALHASAVSFDGRAVIFCGPAGAGKSTAAAACVAAGAALLADDLVAVSEQTSGWLAHPGVRSIRLWDDGARALLQRAERAPQFSPTWEKRVITAELVGGRSGEASTPLVLACFLTERSADVTVPQVTPLAGQAAITALVANTAANYLHDARHRGDELRQAASLLAQVPAVQLTAPADVTRLGALPDAVRARLRV